jgi:ABC-type nitrate/sulfonate/bicarbonate transport system substrate-binding protein
MIGRKELVEDIKKNLKSFKGHTIAKMKNGATDIDVTYLFIDRLKGAGLKEGVDFTYKYYNSWDEMHADHAAGNVDLMVGWNPFDEEYVHKFPQFSLLQLRSLYAYMPCCRQVVLRENLQNPAKREQYVRFERAIIRAYEYTALHPDETARIISEVLKISDDVVFSVLRRPGFRFDPNPNVVGAVAFYDAMKGSVPKSSLGSDVRESIDTSVYKEALLALIQQEPSNKFYASAYKAFQKTSEPIAHRK